MNDEQLLEILKRVWNREDSADDAFEIIESALYAARWEGMLEAAGILHDNGFFMASSKIRRAAEEIKP